jgi:hypothetical protein
MTTTRSVELLLLVAVVLLSATAATASKKLDKTITHKVFFDVEIGGEKAGASPRDTQAC